jgi:CHAT domain-containing protein
MHHSATGYLLLTLICILLFACKEGTIGQQEVSGSSVDSIYIEKQLAFAKAAIANEQVDSAFLFYQNAGAHYATHQSWDSISVLSFKVYKLARATNDFSNAYSVFEYLDQQIPSDRDTLHAKIAELAGNLYYKEGQIEAALEHYSASAKGWQPYPGSLSLLRSYNMLGIIYTILGDYALAEQTYLKSIQLSRERGDTLREQNNFYNLGDAYRSQGLWEKAIISYQNAGKLLPDETGYLELSLADAYLIGGQLDSALYFGKLALDLTQKEYGGAYLSLPYQVLGNTYLSLKDYRSAEQFLSKSLNAALETYPPYHREIGKAHLFLGDAYRLQGLDQLALKEYQNGIKVFLPAFDGGRVEDFPSSDSLLSREIWLMEALRNKGYVFRAMAEKKDQRKNSELAALHFNMAVEYINRNKLFYSESKAKAFLGDYSIPFIEDAVEAYLDLFEQTGQASYQEQAFEIVQQATAFLLRETVNDQNALEVGGVSVDSIELLNDLNTSINDLQMALSEITTIGQQDSLNNLLFQEKQNRLRLLQQLEQNYPKYYDLKYRLAPVPLERLQDDLDSNVLVVKYFLGNDHLYTFAFTRDQNYSVRQPIDSSFFNQMQDYRDALADLDFVRNYPEEAEEQFLRSSRQLYDYLLSPVIDSLSQPSIDQLVVIPDGQLNFLVFECLLTREAESWLEKDAYLLQNYGVRYAYYSALLAQTSQGADVNSRFLGFGTEYDEKTLGALQMIEQDSVLNPSVKDAFRGKKLARLSFADDEVAEIAELLSGKTFVNDQATKQNFLYHAPAYKTIHIAAHSFIDADTDTISYIVFNQAGRDTDFLLSMPEVYNLQLDAELIALSGCQTGLGALQRSEGVLSLARAFQVAGCKSMVASQWSISDRASSVIMKEFYRHLDQGHNKTEALRQAKLQYLNRDELSSPAYRIPPYWAALVFVGEDRPVVFDAVRESSVWYWVIGGVLLMAIWVLIRQVRTRP